VFRVVQATREDVLGGELRETCGDVLHLRPQLPQMARYGAQGNARRVQLGCYRELLRAGYEERVGVAVDRFQYAQFDRLGHGVFAGRAAEAGVGVEVGAALALGAGEEPAVLVGADGSDGGAGAWARSSMR
jgi:hypothetical protein